MELSADYSPNAHGTRLPDVAVRPVEPADLLACGRLAARRQGGQPEAWAERLALSAEAGQELFVAECDGQIVGYGGVGWHDPDVLGGRNVPAGWYLSGCVVDPNRRRQGIGSALTRARMDWVFDRAESIYYVVNATNQASIDLHSKQGFEEVTSDFFFPGVTFVGGHGVLCRAWAPGAGPVAEIIQFPGVWASGN